MRTWTEEEVRALGVRTDLVTAGSILGMGRSRAYQMARAGEFPVPVLPLGNRFVVLVKPLLELLGYDDEHRDPPAPVRPPTSYYDTLRSMTADPGILAAIEEAESGA